MLSSQYISALSSVIHIVCGGYFFLKENMLLLKNLIVLYIQPKLQTGGDAFCFCSKNKIWQKKAKFSGNIFENYISRIRTHALQKICNITTLV